MKLSGIIELIILSPLWIPIVLVFLIVLVLDFLKECVAWLLGKEDVFNFQGYSGSRDWRE